MLDYYKNEIAVEKGFRFLKDKSYRIPRHIEKAGENLGTFPSNGPHPPLLGGGMVYSEAVEGTE
jgi:hypothetical protein